MCKFIAPCFIGEGRNQTFTGLPADGSPIKHRVSPTRIKPAGVSPSRVSPRRNEKIDKMMFESPNPAVKVSRNYREKGSPSPDKFAKTTTARETSPRIHSRRDTMMLRDMNDIQVIEQTKAIWKDNRNSPRKPTRKPSDLKQYIMEGEMNQQKYIKVFTKEKK